MPPLPPARNASRYPFAACEVLCCEVDAIFTTLLDDESLLARLFSLLDAPPPLDGKAAGYFARVVGALLLRKPNEMVQYLSNADGALEKMVGHLEAPAMAELLKRIAGADEQAAMVFLPMHTQWLVETPLLELLLGSGHRTLDPEEADYFFVPSYSSCMFNPVFGGSGVDGSGVVA